MKMQDKIDGLKPYVIGIRFTPELTIVDVVLKDNWVMDESTKIKIGTTEDTPNYYMVYSDNGEFGIDQLLDFVETVIQQNVEREKKIVLLNEKMLELEKLFSDKTLEELLTLKFGFSSNKTEMVNKHDSSKFEIPLNKIPLNKIPEKVIKINNEINTNSKVDDVIEEPTLKIQLEEKFSDLGFELPPKGKKIELETFEPKTSVCKCKAGEMCEICLDM